MRMSDIVVLFLTSCYLVTCCSAQFIPPTVFTAQPRGQATEMRGNTWSSLCSANGYPVPVYRWVKDGRYITSSNSTDSSYKILSIQQSDSGSYQCVASNAYGALLSSAVFLNVAHMQPFGSGGASQNISVQEGRAAVLNVTMIESFPPPTVQWVEVNDVTTYPITRESAKYQVTLLNQLVLLDATQLTDSGLMFRATATNTYTQQSSDTPPYLITVLPPSTPPVLTIIIPPSNTVCTQGDETTQLECVATARPLNYVSIRWYRVTEETGRTGLEQDNIKYLLSTYRRVLTIRNPSQSDSGIYQCEAVFTQPDLVSVTRVSSASLLVQVKPSFISLPPSDVQADVGGPLTLHCEALGVPAPQTLWYRNAELITASQRYTLTDNGSLIITSAQVNDSSVYQCFVSNTAASISYSTWVRINSFQPSIVKPPVNQSVISGDAVRFSCRATGAPKPSVQWFKLSSNNESVEVRGGVEGDLVIQSTQKSDTACYKCVVSNSLGSVSATAYLSVTTRTRIIQPPQNSSAIKGSTVVLRCGVDADVSVGVEWVWWLRSGSGDGVQAIPFNPRQSVLGDGGLQIQSIRNTDIGAYTCFVVSVGGNDSFTAVLTVVELPYPPTIQLISLTGPTSVLLTWVAGFDGNSPILRYVVQYRMFTQNSTTDTWHTVLNNVPADKLNILVTDLIPSKSYQFHVSAVNTIGEGESSGPSGVIEIPEQPPSGPPRGVVASPRSNSSIVLQWDPPDSMSWNGALLGYVINTRLSGYPDSTVTTLNVSRVLTVELSGLIVFQQYEISIAAYNRKGVGVFCPPIYCRTLEGRPSTSPRDVTVTPLSSTQFNVTWLPPEPQYINGINQGYHITAFLPSTTPLLFTVPSNLSNLLDRQSFVVSGLLKFTLYNISISCFTSVGDGPLSSTVQSTTLDDVPDAVTGLSFESVLDVSLVVVWTSPVHPNGVLLGYNVTYGKRGSKDLTRAVVESNVTRYTVTGLIASTQYTVSVCAYTRLGCGPTVSADIQSGVTPQLPEAPSALTISNIGSSSATVRFLPGFDGYTSISRWIVECQTGRNEEQNWREVFNIHAPDASDILVLNLTPYTTYRLRLIAENAAGHSPPSDPTRWFDTLPALPSSPPTGLLVRPLNATALRVQWTPLLDQEWNGGGKMYSVQWRRSGESVFSFAQSVTDEYSSFTDLISLSPWVEYDVRIVAVNDVGASNYSSTVTQRTRESAPSMAPQSLNASAISSTDITVTWLPLDSLYRNGRVLGYRLLYKKQGDTGVPTVLSVEQGVNVTEFVIGQLLKFMIYEIRVEAYTSVGAGPPTDPPLTVRTLEALPGPPTAVYFPQVSETSVTLVWDAPVEPNGVITGYRITYRQSSDSVTSSLGNVTLGAGERSFVTGGLVRNSYYRFAVAASTRLGWGEPVVLDVYTVTYRLPPDPPSKPNIGGSQRGARWVVISWVPGDDGYAPIRNYSIQYEQTSVGRVKRDVTDSGFIDVLDYVSASQTSYNVTGLTPDTGYRFRVASCNDVGRGEYGPLSDEVKTDPAPPDLPPQALTAASLTPTTARVTWEPADPASWNGPLTGHEIFYREIGQSDWRSVSSAWPNLTLVISGLTLQHSYEIKARTINIQGVSGFSDVLQLFMELSPSGTVPHVTLLNVSSHELTISWAPIPPSLSNGDILGYRLYWGSQARVLAPSLTTFTITDLTPYTLYNISILAYNAAGDGMNTSLTALTAQATPSSPVNLTLIVISPSQVNASWSLPASTNGIITLYEISYLQTSLVDGLSQSVTVLTTPNVTYCVASRLINGMPYSFSVRARTSVGWGESISGNVTVGPQAGTPGPPGQPVCVLGSDAVYLTWRQGAEGNAPITHYIIELKSLDDKEWSTALVTTDSKSSADVRLLAIKTSSDYQFRVTAVNLYGIGVASEASEIVGTGDVLSSIDRPFYQRWWFLVIIALISIILLLLLVFILCITGRRYRAAERDKRLAKTIVRLNEVAGFTDPNTINSHYNTAGMARPDTHSVRPAPSRSSTLTAAPRAPPRPSPGSVLYCEDEGAVGWTSEDEDDEKFDSSSLSEKSSQVSSQSSHRQQSFPNHYATGGVTDSWRRRVAPPDSSFTSDTTSQYGITSHSNLHPGSRAPLPGFSSFV